jgi:hypothetical protein
MTPPAPSPRATFLWFLLLRYSIILRGILNQPAPLNLCDIANKSLFSGLQDFMEYDPVSFAVLDKNARVSKVC